jgi:hypothetical protein
MNSFYTRLVLIFRSHRSRRNASFKVHNNMRQLLSIEPRQKVSSLRLLQINCPTHYNRQVVQNRGACWTSRDLAWTTCILQLPVLNHTNNKHQHRPLAPPLQHRTQRRLRHPLKQWHRQQVSTSESPDFRTSLHSTSCLLEHPSLLPREISPSLCSSLLFRFVVPPCATGSW